jgi:hypothetical protein
MQTINHVFDLDPAICSTLILVGAWSKIVPKMKEERKNKSVHFRDALRRYHQEEHGSDLWLTRND